LGNECYLFVRPEHVELEPKSSTNLITATLLRRDLEGAFVSYHLETGVGQTFVSQVTNLGPVKTNIKAIGFSPERAFALPVSDVARTGREQLP
jgi:spermidine/putrescine transport system ATP-binding protein